MRADLLRLLAAAAASAILVVPARASAYCRTTTDGLREGCTLTATQCCTQGKPLYWKNACVGYSLQQSASKQVTLQQATDAMAKAFAQWTSAPCSGGKVSMDVKDLGPVTCDQVQYNSDQGNQHVIVFRDHGWDHSDPNNTLALTTLTFDPNNGEIYDADMEINTSDQTLTVNDPIPRDGFDFLSVVTHESGHFLGLAHTGEPTATMYPKYKPGSTTLRVLHADDVAGICAAYPADGSRPTADGVLTEDACDPTPRHGEQSGCGVPQKTGCSVAPERLEAGADGSSSSSSSSAPVSAFALVGLFGLVSFTRKRSRST